MIGVALGLTAAGFCLTPVLLIIQRRLCGVRVRTQLGRILAPVHSSIWAALAYLLIRQIGNGAWFTVLVGGASYLVITVLVLVLVHRAALLRVLAAGREIFGGGAPQIGPRRAQRAITTANPEKESRT